MTESAERVSREQYIQRWTDHVNELNGLRWNLTQDERDQLELLQTQLHELIEAASERRES